MRRGEVWWVSFEPSIGGEIRKKRPAIIVSNDAANQFLNRVQAVPLTSKARRLFPSEAYVSVQLTRPDLDRVKHAMLIQLGVKL